MAKGASFKYLLLILCLFFVLTLGSSGIVKTEQKDEYQQPTTTFPTTPITSPVTVLPSPTIVTVPSTNPLTVTPTPTTPATYPFTAPVTNPVTTPSTNNPVTTYPTPSPYVPAPVTNPVASPATATVPAVPGQTWCVAKTGASEAAIQAGIDYACGLGGADCSMIQMGASCFNPDTLMNHASYAFNSYYQKNPVPTSCDFGGSAMVTNVNPSSGSCVYPLLSSSTTPPTTSTPIPTPTTPYIPTPTPYIPTPTTSSSSGATPVPMYGSPPTVVNTGYPPGITTITGETPTTGGGTNTSVSMSSTTLRPFIFSTLTLLLATFYQLNM